jgi:hypothetical protein
VTAAAYNGRTKIGVGCSILNNATFATMVLFLDIDSAAEPQLQGRIAGNELCVAQRQAHRRQLYACPELGRRRLRSSG